MYMNETPTGNFDEELNNIILYEWLNLKLGAAVERNLMGHLVSFAVLYNYGKWKCKFNKYLRAKLPPTKGVASLNKLQESMKKNKTFIKQIFQLLLWKQAFFLNTKYVANEKKMIIVHICCEIKICWHVFKKNISYGLTNYEKRAVNKN